LVHAGGYEALWRESSLRSDSGIPNEAIDVLMAAVYPALGHGLSIQLGARGAHAAPAPRWSIVIRTHRCGGRRPAAGLSSQRLMHRCTTDPENVANLRDGHVLLLVQPSRSPGGHHQRDPPANASHRQQWLMQGAPHENVQRRQTPQPHPVLFNINRTARTCSAGGLPPINRRRPRMP
jgi:hypothetical protein